MELMSRVVVLSVEVVSVGRCGGLRVRMRAPLPLFHCVAPREAARECFSALATASPTDATHRPPGKHLQTFGLTDAAGKAGNLPVFFGTFYGIGLEIDLEERGVFLTAPIHPVCRCQMM